MIKRLLRKQTTFYGHVINKVSSAHIVVVGLAIVLCYSVLVIGWNLPSLYWLFNTFCLLTSLVLISEVTLIAFWYSSASKKNLKRGLLQRCLRFARVISTTDRAMQLEPKRNLPRCSLIVVAYLPNEQNIIVDTLKHILMVVEKPKDGLEVILAYNTPVQLPIEDDLKHLAYLHPELRLLFVEASRSKAENLNAALKIVTGEITGILDADHRPAADCLRRAWCWLENDWYDVVQGRNVIRNHNCNLLTKIISIEFESLYGINHLAPSLLVDIAIFGGTNGYWRTSVLDHLQFCPDMLTEDVDITAQTLFGGYRIVNDPMIVSTELAPMDIQSLWVQRKRWAQGWLEVILKYQWFFLRSDKLNVWQKVYWIKVLLSSLALHVVGLPIFLITSTQVFGNVSFSSLTHDYVWMVAVLSLLIEPYQTLVAKKVNTPIIRLSFIDLALYWLAAPLYYTFKNLTIIAAIYNHLLGKKEWIVTRRDPN
jgi:cellulose synthase/poly-beta-1,6-N-acetylglucosamine synthase-like glycosyltransferase